MAHYAKVENSLVTQVIVAEAEFFDTFVDSSPGEWIQTSFNGNFRGKYASIGDTWDKVNEVFISPQPFPSWTLDTDFVWNAPTPYPTDGKMYTWDEETLAWIEITGETI